MNSINRIALSLQAIATTDGIAGVSTASVGNRVSLQLSTVDSIADATSSTTGSTLGALLPSTTEQATSSATSNADQATLMGQTVGAALFESGGTVNWRDFATQAKSTLAAAGYNDADVAVYIGAVKQTYRQYQAQPVPAATVSVSTSAGASDSSLSSGSDTMADFPDGATSTDSIPDSTDGVMSSTGGATSTAALAIATSQLPSTDLPANSFASLAQQAYNGAWASAGSGVNIDELVANTQTEMDSLGYSTDQVDNYMIGLFQAYNTNAFSSTASVATTPGASTPDTTTDGSNTASTTVYDPNPSYDPLLNDGDDGY